MLRHASLAISLNHVFGFGHRDLVHGAFFATLLHCDDVELLGALNPRIILLLLEVNNGEFRNASEAIRVDDLVAFEIRWLNEGLTLRLQDVHVAMLHEDEEEVVIVAQCKADRLDAGSSDKLLRHVNNLALFAAVSVPEDDRVV